MSPKMMPRVTRAPANERVLMCDCIFQFKIKGPGNGAQLGIPVWSKRKSEWEKLMRM